MSISICGYTEGGFKGGWDSYHTFWWALNECNSELELILFTNLGCEFTYKNTKVILKVNLKQVGVNDMSYNIAIMVMVILPHTEI